MTDDQAPPEPAMAAPTPAPGPVTPTTLDKQLGGDLPCAVCSYNLRGLSIRSVCPECGTAVRATILALVDPHAAELEPIPRPRLTALGLVAWFVFALAANVLCWLPPPAPRWYGVWHALVVACVLASGAGALSLIRPHAGAKLLYSVAAVLGVLLYLPLAWLVWELTSTRWTAGQSAIYPYILLVAHERAPTTWRVLVCLLVSGIAILLRPNARLLVARSLALRTGRVDRQTILAIVAAAIIAAIGEGALEYSRLLPGGSADVFRLAGQILIPAGWALFTLGLIGSLIDAIRIGRAILMPAPSLHEVIAPGSITPAARAG